MRVQFLSVLLLLGVFTSAQDSVFQIKDYKYRTPGFRALAASFNLSGLYNKSKTNDFEPASSGLLSLGPAAVGYFRIISTDTRLHESSLNVSAGGYTAKHSGNQNNTRESRFAPSFSWNRSDRFYKTNRWFFEVGNELSAGYGSNRIRDTLRDQLNWSANVHNRLTLGVGKGRVERVQDAQMALYILQDLGAQGLLNGPVSAETANELAVLITDINNRRVFDFRRRRVYELTRIDSFLRSSGLTGPTDIRHFTTVNDNWALAFNPYRLSGQNWYLRLQPSLHFTQGVGKYIKPLLWPESRSEMSTLNLGPTLGYENYKSVTLQWQRNFGASLSYARSRTLQQTSISSGGGTPNKINDDVSGWRTELTAFYGIGFFPNNRTQVNAALRVDAVEAKEKHRYVQPALNLDVNYFISYRTYLSASANIGYTHLELTDNAGAKTKSQNLFSNMSVTLSHVVF